MSIGFLRRSGSRGSIRRLARPSVPRAPGLYKHPMPPRITQESYRPRVSDRTMVANFATATLASFGARMASSRYASMKPLGWRMIPPRRSAAGRTVKTESQPHRGLDAREYPRPPVGAEECLLTSPFIGQGDKDGANSQNAVSGPRSVEFPGVGCRAASSRRQSTAEPNDNF